MKHKIGEKTSTSLLPLTHGPSKDYTQRIPEAIMVMEGPPEINPPSGRVPGQELLLIPILESWRRQNSGKYRETESSLRVSGMGVKYRPKGAPGVAPPGQAAKGRGQPLAALGDRLVRGWLIRPKRIYNFFLFHASFGDIITCFDALSYHLQHIWD